MFDNDDNSRFWGRRQIRSDHLETVLRRERQPEQHVVVVFGVFVGPLVAGPVVREMAFNPPLLHRFFIDMLFWLTLAGQDSLEMV